MHRAAAKKIHACQKQVDAGRLDAAACEVAYASVYSAVAGILGLRMGLERHLDDLGTHSTTVGSGPHTSFALSQSGVPTSAPSFHPGSPRMPYECEICGAFPAVPVTAVWVLSVLLVAKVHRETKVLCRQCGVNVTSRAQAYTRSWGHFGVGVVAAWVSQWKNRGMLRALRRFTEPYARRPGVLTPESRPRTTGWFLRLWTVGAGLGWLVMLAVPVVRIVISH
ncbi:hypothetical protein M878_44710 [Streptomyces roseochromogenus subsp. oscitans DS 12.976]|uniref:Uncharacterized protein n=1 Tax=Streptomyces roseochromogenus subsp. oscitans DS 12.976 TaxID=1352936 RepID=V6JET2_STRRC|nr:hypothetical protein M878_44710 [Streptomyces roseochromogenus subsp. oscitans DS 12.976]